MKLLVLFALFATLAQSAPGIGSSEPWPDVDDACYQMDKTCEIREIFILSICQSTIPLIKFDDMFVIMIHVWKVWLKDKIEINIWIFSSQRALKQTWLETSPGCRALKSARTRAGWEHFSKEIKSLEDVFFSHKKMIDPHQHESYLWPHIGIENLLFAFRLSLDVRGSLGSNSHHSVCANCAIPLQFQLFRLNTTIIL